jgi:hypothetical protein
LHETGAEAGLRHGLALFPRIGPKSGPRCGGIGPSYVIQSI